MRAYFFHESIEQTVSINVRNCLKSVYMYLLISAKAISKEKIILFVLMIIIVSIMNEGSTALVLEEGCD